MLNPFKYGPKEIMKMELAKAPVDADVLSTYLHMYVTPSLVPYSDLSLSKRANCRRVPKKHLQVPGVVVEALKTHQKQAENQYGSKFRDFGEHPKSL